MIKGYKYRIKDKNARKALRAHAYAVNQVWNWCVAQHRDQAARYAAGAPRRSWPTAFDLCASCKGVGRDLGTLQGTVQSVCDQFTKSRNRSKRGLRFRPSFGANRALGWVPFQPKSRKVVGNSVIYYGKTYRFWEGGRPLPDTAKSGAFVEDAKGRWFVVFSVEAECGSHANGNAIGIDLGLKSLATTSDGEIIENPRHVARYAERLAVAHRSRNKKRAAAIYAKIRAVRADFHHKLSTRLAREYALIAVGNVRPKALAKTRMAKSVLDAGWSSFRNMLRYKAAQFVEVDERFTTQTCSSCGSLPPERPKGIAGLGLRSWDCSACGASHDRDVNAAKNILAIARGAPRLAEENRVVRIVRDQPDGLNLEDVA